MIVDRPITRLRRSVARRRIAIRIALLLPLMLALVALFGRQTGIAAACAAAFGGAVLLGLLAWRTWRSTDAAWLARRLDALDPRMEDSAALLTHDPRRLTPLAGLQRQRLQRRLAEQGVDARPVWPRGALGIAWGAALGVLLAGWLWAPAPRSAAGSAAGQPAETLATRLVQARVRIVPPAYTGLGAREVPALDAEVPAGAQLTWQLRFAPEPRAAALVLHDGRRVPLERGDGAWRGGLALAESTLYRVELTGAPALKGGLHRLDVIADQAPTVRVSAPEHTLSLLASGQTEWTLDVEATDDYGIAGAQLAVELAQISGDSVQVRAQTVDLDGTALDGTRHVRYRHTLDLAALDFAEGDDLIVRVLVRDNREPAPKITRSASFILRWPAAAPADVADLDGVVQRTLPAYFRSQRQIIIDSEALVAARTTLGAERFLDRSDAIGVDQKILRLRYGQFLGEESETAGQRGEGGPQDHDAHEHGATHEPSAPPRMGDAGDVLAEYGHTHDSAEAATLLDPQTRAILKSALAEMWQAELHLRQGEPALALPFEYRALDFIKQVQQASRIYLARVGLELPVPDESRRLSGDREGLADVRGTLAPATGGAQALGQAWQALAGVGAPDWNALEDQLAARQRERGDALEAMVALDRARADPACNACRRELRARLWPLLAVPPPVTGPRREPDALGRAWLERLERLHGMPEPSP